MTHQKILKFLENRSRVPTAQIVRFTKLDTDTVLKVLTDLRNLGQVTPEQVPGKGRAHSYVLWSLSGDGV